MIFGAILAGGIGSRMGISDMPKQFLPLMDKPIIIHTLEKFLLCNRFDFIYLGIHPSWVPHMQNLVQKYIQNSAKIRIVNGGADRNETIQKIVSGIENDWGDKEDHILITHDAVRPFVSLQIIENAIDATLKNGACDTVVPSTDTIVESINGTTISSIPQRSRMYQGQTPQGFNMQLLKKLYQQLTPQERESLTDACKICVMRDIPVTLIKGDLSNIKLTTVEDYYIAQAMIRNSKSD